MISIIIPVYNAEKWLHRCVDSVLCQTYYDFEIILVDDGSIDGSAKICDEYAKKDRRIKVVHKKNEGVSSARQIGIENVHGDYVIHIDADDYIENDMLEKMYEVATQHNSDVVICDYYEVYQRERKYIEQKPSGFNIDDLTIDLLKGKLMGSLWNKLFNVKCYNNISFPYEMTYEEDLRACILILQNVKKISYVNDALYNYVRDENGLSLSKKYTWSSYNSEQILFQSIRNIVQENSDLLNAYRYRYTLSAYLVFVNRVVSRKEYLQKYKNDRKLFISCDISLKIKWFTIISSSGLYYSSYYFYKFLRFIAMIVR